MKILRWMWCVHVYKQYLQDWRKSVLQDEMGCLNFKQNCMWYALGNYFLVASVMGHIQLNKMVYTWIMTLTMQGRLEKMILISIIRQISVWIIFYSRNLEVLWLSMVIMDFSTLPELPETDFQGRYTYCLYFIAQQD